MALTTVASPAADFTRAPIWIRTANGTRRRALAAAAGFAGRVQRAAAPIAAASDGDSYCPKAHEQRWL